MSSADFSNSITFRDATGELVAFGYKICAAFEQKIRCVRQTRRLGGKSGAETSFFQLKFDGIERLPTDVVRAHPGIRVAKHVETPRAMCWIHLANSMNVTPASLQ
jgi:hypothetical protein